MSFYRGLVYTGLLQQFRNRVYIQKSVHPNYSASETLEKKEGTIDFAFQEGQLYEKQLHPALVWSLESVKIYANFSGEIVSFGSPGRFDMNCVGNRNPNENVQSTI